MKRLSGFTLLELLVALSIFSVLGLGSYQMLQTVTKSNERVRASVATYAQLNLAFAIIQRDFTQYLPRQVRDEYGEPKAPILFDDEDYIIEFSRGGWSNPAGRARSRAQRVAYSVDYEKEVLTRHFWEVLDRAEDSEPISQVLLEGVTDFRVTAFTGDDSSLEDDFELDDAAAVAPIAVEVVITTEAVGEIQRLLQLVEPYIDSGEQAVGSNNSGDNADVRPNEVDDEN